MARKKKVKEAQAEVQSIAPPTTEYRWRVGSRMHISAQAAGERVESLRVKLDKPLSRLDIYDDAQKTDSPFHAEVFKDAPKTAEKKWRLEVCGRILREIEMVHVAYEESGGDLVEIRAPVMVHVKSLGYERAARVLTDADLRRAAMSEIADQLRAFKNKWQRYQTLTPILEAALHEAEKLARDEAI